MKNSFPTKLFICSLFVTTGGGHKLRGGGSPLAHLPKPVSSIPSNDVLTPENTKSLHDDVNVGNTSKNTIARHRRNLNTCDNVASLATYSAVNWPAKGVLLRAPLKPNIPALALARQSPLKAATSSPNLPKVIERFFN